MLSRTLLPGRLALRSPALRATYSTTTDNPVPANNPNSPAPRSPVSATNATPTSSEGSMDASLQESVEKGEERRVMQAPNRQGVWSKSQQPREKAMVGPRFEQTIMLDQVGFLHRREVWREGLWLTILAASAVCDGAHPQAARALDEQEGRFVRWRWRSARPPENLYQHR